MPQLLDLRLSGQLPDGATVEVLSVTSGDRGLVRGASPHVVLPRKGWTGTALTTRVTSGEPGARRTGWVRFKVKVRARIVVAARHIRRGQMLAGADLRVASRVLRPHDKSFAGADEVVGRRTKRALRRGDVVLSRWIVIPLAVSRGDRIRGVLKRGALTLRFTLEALQRARIGQTIRAPVVSTGKIIRVRVTGERRAEVTL